MDNGHLVVVAPSESVSKVEQKSRGHIHMLLSKTDVSKIVVLVVFPRECKGLFWKETRHISWHTCVQRFIV